MQLTPLSTHWAPRKKNKKKGYNLFRTRCIMWQCNAFLQPFLHWKIDKCYIFWVCVSSLSYPACKAHALYCHLWHIWLYHFLFSTLYYKRRDFQEGKVVSIQDVFWFSLQVCLKHFSFWEEFSEMLSLMHTGLQLSCRLPNSSLHRGADKSLARPGRKQGTATEDFDFHISYL